MKNKRGITLIALVVTIVILIILSSVGIYLTLGNNGILNKAKEAKNETLKQAATEKINLKITNMQIETYGQEQRMPTLQEFADGLCEDNEIQYVQLQSKKVGSLEKINVGNASSIFTKLKEYPYEFEINSSLQLASIDGVKVATNTNNSQEGKISKELLFSNNQVMNTTDTYTLSENYDNYEYLLFETQYLNGIAGVSTTWILTGHIEQQENFTYGGNNFNSSIGLWCANSWLAIYFTGDNTFKVGAFGGNDGALIISNIYGIN